MIKWIKLALSEKDFKKLHNIKEEYGILYGPISWEKFILSKFSIIKLQEVKQ